MRRKNRTPGANEVNSMDPLYSFRPVTASDLPRLRHWLKTPQVVRWWGDPRREFELLKADLGEPRITMRLVSFHGRPFAYAQDYEAHAWPQSHLAHLPERARAIDSFIGVPSMIGRGHGAAYLRLLAELLCAVGAPLVAIDPRADNLRARRAYAKAGFVGERRVATEAGPAVLMIYDPARIRMGADPKRMWRRPQIDANS
jgi:RimJ/RimL family protein N-acetyltransferase